MIRFFLLFLSIYTFILNAQTGENWFNYLQNNRSTPYKSIEKNFNIDKHNIYTKHFERLKWKNKNLLNDDGSVTTQNELVIAYKKYKSSKTSNNFGNWSPLGPFSWVNGDNGYNPGNGRINAINVDPNNSNIIYACASSGGLWKSNDAGTTWNTNTDNLTILGTSDIAINPQNSNILYLATGDRDGLDTYGIGVLKSIDGGSTWQPTGLHSNIPTETFIVNCLAINNNNPNIIFAGTSSGLFRTEDAGTTWQEIITSGNFKQIKINPLNPNTVFAADNKSFFRSYNSGLTFECITEGLPTSGSRIVFDVTPADSSYIYLMYANTSGNFGGVYQSVDGGSSFTMKVDINTINLLGYDIDGLDDATQAWYDLALAVSPSNKLEIYTGGINIWKSTDGGTNWQNSSNWVYTTPSTYSHADIHSLNFYGNTLYCGSDGGAFSKNGNDVWSNISNGLNISQIYSFSNSELNPNLITIGCQDNGSNLLNFNQWTHIMGADGMKTIIDYSDQTLSFITYQYGAILRSDFYGEYITNIFNPDDYSETSEWLTPYVLSHSTKYTMYVGCTNIYKTENGGVSWAKTTDYSTIEFDVMAIAPTNDNIVIAYNGSVFIRTTDGGITWQPLNTLIGGAITDIEFSNTDENIVYACLTSGHSSRVYKSVDCGTNFTQITKTLPALGSNCLALEDNDVNGIYLGMEFGVVYTNDNLTEWIDFSENLPNVKVTDIQHLSSINKVRLATFGRGVWESDTFNSSVNIESSQLFSNFKIYPNPAKENINIEANNFSKIVIYNSSGVLIKNFDNTSNTINFSTSNLVEGLYFVKVIAKNGEYYTKSFIKN